jgi:hypothetical protein
MPVVYMMFAGFIMIPISMSFIYVFIFSSIVDDTECLQSAYGCYLNMVNHCRSYSSKVIYVDSINGIEGTGCGTKASPCKVCFFLYLFYFINFFFF